MNVFRNSLNKILFILILWAQDTGAQDSEGSLLNWMDWKEVAQRLETEPRPVMLNFYTDWCGWCKHMKKTTFANPGIASYINSFFYPVKFNAEGRDTVEFLGKKYFPGPEGQRSAHELAVHLLQGKLSYPTTLFLNGYEKDKKEFRVNMLASGFLDAQKIEPILVFTLENVSRNSSLDEFRDEYAEAFQDSTLNDRIQKLKWEQAEIFFNGRPSNSKKTLVFIQTDWCNACRVMQRSGFTKPDISSYIDTVFNLVNFNAEIKSDLVLNDKIFSSGSMHNDRFHPLAFYLTRNSISFPSLVLLSEEGEVLDAIPSYIPPSVLGNILRFYGDDIYKSKSWQDYMKLLSDAKKH
ncbi:MAG: DUF255 domain-containing protein [Bacteroidetes bacterium]|nr:MAG: DUF255 domain-containing protein [Bacteroidota bacterium]REK00678.1 MAG: DUF255 domain-containing protein [Bacteroidota bacterium]REK35200.1 MAG: DUF255 domain-containing protein [Bacteroidota bacterium]REK48277.1 MAG: DUF255 domain-containing protein [Bacteroidota bacterium]